MIKKQIIPQMYLIIGSVLLLLSCSDNKHLVDVSHINTSPELVRFEQDLFSCKNVNDLRALQQKQPIFFQIYTHNIMPHITGMDISSKREVQELFRYINHPDMDSLYQLTQKKFDDFEDIYNDLARASKYIQYHFKDTIKTITTFVATFEYGSIYDEANHGFGIGLDMYMGRDFEVYALLNPQNFPAYRVKRFESYNVVPNCIRSYLNTKIKEPLNASFLNQAVYEGKKLYAMDALLPKTHDSLKIGYLDGQLEWCIDNEKNIWSYLIEKELLFSSEQADYVQNFFNDGPFTTPFGNESSPRTGAWIGWQIVKAYMDQHPDMTLNALLAEKDHLKIFKQSGYKP